MTVFGLAYGQRMTLYQTLRGASLVFCDFQNARHHAAADEFHDRPRTDWRDAAGDAMEASRPQAYDRFIGAACDLRLVAARKAPALSARDAIPGLGCLERRTRRHHRPGWTDRCRPFGGPWHGRPERRGRPDCRNRRACA